MNTKLIKNFFFYTFIIWIFTWGIAVLLTQCCNLTFENVEILILRFLGGFSPTIASYISLKKCNMVDNLKDWLKKIFKIKDKMGAYIIAVFLTFVEFFLLCLTSDFQIEAPIYSLIWFIPIMLLLGGNEEVGWRMILQPELEKKYSFLISTIITSIIWWIWHLPLFYIVGDSHMEQNFILFGLLCICEAFALASIRRIGKEIFPCIFFHCLTNALFNVFVIENNYIGSIITTCIIVFLSVMIVKIYEHNKKS